MKKISLFLSVGFIILAFGASSAWAQNSNKPSAPPTLVGDWDLIGHECTSNAPPADHFMPSRDRVQVIFRDHDFTSNVQMNGCSSWTRGHYEIRENRVLTLFNDQVQSNCPVQNGPRQISYSIDFLDADTFVIYLGPVDGGICPAGDLLENTYRRFH